MDRMDRLRSLGVSVGAVASGQGFFGDFSSQLTSPSLTGYGEFTRITVRSKTIRTDHADVESNQRRDRSVARR